MTHTATELFAGISALRTELVDLAFTLDRCGRADAADVALDLSHRLTELCDRFETQAHRSAPVRLAPIGVSPE